MRTKEAFRAFAPTYLAARQARLRIERLGMALRQLGAGSATRFGVHTRRADLARRDLWHNHAFRFHLLAVSSRLDRNRSEFGVRAEPRR